MLLPPDLREWVPEDDLVHFVIEAVDRLPLESFRVNHRGTGAKQFPLHGMVGSVTNGAGGPKSPSMARKPSGIPLVSDWLGEIIYSISPRSLRLLAEFSAERTLTPTGS
jgi:hypothetical protein